jgi:hypothetical protein
MKNICPYDHFFIRPVKDHKEIKSKILDAISSMGQFSIRAGINNITNTDWHLPADFIRPYHQIIKPALLDHTTAIKEKFKYNDVKIGNYWFQQYHQGDYFGWHVHEGCMFSSVYYVNLEDSIPKTSFIIDGEEICVNAEEGVILTFPSFLVHRSTPNQSNKIKTVISFNMDGLI